MRAYIRFIYYDALDGYADLSDAYYELKSAGSKMRTGDGEEYYQFLWKYLIR